MAEEQIINFSCPQCGAVFELPSSFVGQLGECTECGKIFEIKFPDDAQTEEAVSDPNAEVSAQESPQETIQEQSPSEEPRQSVVPAAPAIDDGTVKMEKPPELNTTNTVKLSRMKVGMMPQLQDDRFKLEKHVATQKSIASGTSTRRTFSSSSRRNIKKPTAPVKKKPWWSFLLFWKKD